MSDVSCFCVWRETIKCRATSVSYWRKRLRASTSPFSASRLLQLLHGIQSLAAHFFSDASVSTHIVFHLLWLFHWLPLVSLFYFVSLPPWSTPLLQLSNVWRR